MYVASAFVGVGIAAAAGLREWRGWMPAVGLAALLIVALPVVSVFDSGAATALVCLAAAGAGGWFGRSTLRTFPWREGIPVTLGLLAVTSIPFLVDGRFGPLGQSLNHDLSFHMAWADWLAEGRSFRSSGYPLGPHAVVAALAWLPGVDEDSGFTGLLMAVPALTGVCALGLLGVLSPRLRVVAALVAGLPYLAAAYFVQGSFKEPLMALFFLAAVAVVGEGRRRVAVVALVVLAAGSMACFSAPSLVWIAAAVVAAGLVRSRPRVSRRVVWLALALAALAALATIPTGFFTDGAGRYLFRGDLGPGGNFRGELNPLEVLGVWPSPEFQAARSGAAWVAALAVGIVAAAAGLWAWRRSEDRLPVVALVLALVIALAADLVTIPYLSAKALVVAAPLLVVVVLGGLFAHRPRRTALAVAWALGCGVFVALAAHSSLLAVRGAAVTPPTAGAELEALQPIVRGQPTLFLGEDPYAVWYLRDSRLSIVPWSAPIGAAGTVNARPGKQLRGAGLADFDTPPDLALARARYVVAPRTGFASRPPEDFRLVRAGRRYLLYRREGAHRPRFVLREGPAPGAVFVCPRGPTSAPGVASVIPPPVVAGAPHWRFLDGAPLPLEGTEGVLPPTYLARVRLRLPAGRWSVSLSYRARFDTAARLDRRRLTLPAFLGDRFAPLELGEVSGGREVEVEVTGAYRSRGVANMATFVGAVTATRVGVRPRLIPLRAACGRYVDWYRPGRG